ncbi:MAG: polysaccharide biosynthesis C-terminal domain-containing protein, partial [Clostridia bacterium]|nr:polysaccharide biosynthesis C-terminal domain-containing protein [Clostridia bacterium]
AAIFHSMGKSKITMTASLVMNLINFFGNALLIYVYHMGAAGAAIATLFSRIVGAGIMLFLVHNKNNLVYVEKLLHYKPNMDIIKRICAIGIPNGLENGMFQFGKVLTQSLVSTFPTVQIAANAVANSITALQYVPGNATGTTMITVVGRCIGAGEKTMAKKYTLKLIGITYMLAAIISAVLCIFAKPIVGVFNLSGESLEIARNIILIHSLFICAVWPVAFTMTNAFRAASDVKYTMLISVSSMWVFRVGLSYVFAKHLNMGVMSIWVAMFCDWIFRASLFGIRYVRGTWLTKYKYDEL